jgi:maltose-binding protein MalE
MAGVGHIPALTNLKVDTPRMQQAMKALAGGVTYPALPAMDAYSASLDTALRAVFKDNLAAGDALRNAQQTIQSTLTGPQTTATITPAP